MAKVTAPMSHSKLAGLGRLRAIYSCNIQQSKRGWACQHIHTKSDSAAGRLGESFSIHKLNVGIRHPSASDSAIDLAVKSNLE